MTDLADYSARVGVFSQPMLKAAIDFVDAAYGDSMRSVPVERFGNCAIEFSYQRCIRLAVSVALLGQEDWVVAAALLFDCVAACGANESTLSEAGVPEQVISTVMALQRRDGESVASYLARVARDKATLVIKRAELCELVASSDPDHFSSYKHVVWLDMLVRSASSKYA